MEIAFKNHYQLVISIGNFSSNEKTELHICSILIDQYQTRPTIHLDYKHFKDNSHDTFRKSDEETKYNIFKCLSKRHAVGMVEHHAKEYIPFFETLDKDNLDLLIHIGCTSVKLSEKIEKMLSDKTSQLLVNYKPLLETFKNLFIIDNPYCFALVEEKKQIVARQERTFREDPYSNF